MGTAALQFQKLGLQGVKTLVKSAEGEGWNPGPYDADVFMQQTRMAFTGFMITTNWWRVALSCLMAVHLVLWDCSL